MKREGKQQIISKMIDSFNKCESVFVLSCPKISVEKTFALRKKLFSVGGTFTVVKNTLLKLVAEKSETAKIIESSFSNKIALVFANENTTAVAAAIKASGYGEDIKVNLGVMNNLKIDVSKFEFLATIPSKEVLHAQLCGVLKGNIAKLVYILNEVLEKNKNA